MPSRRLHCARAPAGICGRFRRLAAGVKPAPFMPFVGCLRSASSGPRTPRTTTDPTLRPSFVRERRRASRLPSSVGASRP